MSTCLCLCLSVCVCVCVCVCACACVCVCVYVSVSVSVSVSGCLCVYVSMCLSVRVSVSVCLCVCVHGCTCALVCRCLHGMRVRGGSPCLLPPIAARIGGSKVLVRVEVRYTYLDLEISLCCGRRRESGILEWSMTHQRHPAQTFKVLSLFMSYPPFLPTNISGSLACL